MSEGFLTSWGGAIADPENCRDAAVRRRNAAAVASRTRGERETDKFIFAPMAGAGRGPTRRVMFGR